MAGIDATSGAVLDGFPHVEQSLGKIFTTFQGERAMREWFGNPGLRLLGENATSRTILLWFNVLWMLVELFEPRFKVVQFVVNDVNRLGYGDFTINGKHLPYGHLDWEQARLFVSIDGGTVTLKPSI
ncbi:GPW/gp25 family protein [Mesorhizobium sp. M0045]|uniref:GPW/gp25 family protein n=1 Tax=unclassified Mesorhizobium TaxID=325217 RepID=UPI0003CEB55C|nr:GPW/gp25 family protein [Mesorhizobium sp. LSJC280B00]ESW92660.1 baseplate assembly protein [Mesorhizobium sp. LSJC280B00]